MRKRLRQSVLLLLFAALVGSSPASGQGRRSAKGKVDLLSSVGAVVPGKPFDVALRFELADGWHIYWENSGDSGQPPKVTWNLPDGFSAGDLRFPIPKRHVSGGDIVTNILEGRPALLVELTPPDAISAAKVTLAAHVRYLICNKNCLIEQADVSVELPVATADPAPANEAVFRRATRALPKASSKYLTVTAATEPALLSAGTKFDVLVNIDIKRGFHIQSDKPLNPAFIKSEVFIGQTDEVYFEAPVFPPPKFRTVKVVGKVSEFAGRITVRVPGEVDAEAGAGTFPIGGIFRFQACNDGGTCFPPTAVAFASASGNGQPTKIGAATEEPSPGAQQAGQPKLETTETDNAAVPAEPVVPAIAGEAEGFELEKFLRTLGLPGLLIGCFLYGLFINATPCVLPLLSIKVLGFVQQAHDSRGRTMLLGAAFGTGVIIFFVVLGFLAAAGTNILHYPAAVIALCAVILALSLSMLGVFTLQVPTSAVNLDANIQQEGVLASFSKGALAPVLGFACTGPLMVGIFGWATQQPREIALLAFLVTGIGMASPYMLFGAFPSWLSFLPRPGNWMITFERLMGFLMLLMVVWLLNPVASRLGGEGLLWTVGFFVFVGLACWVLGRIDISMSQARRFRFRAVAVGLVVGPAFFVYGWQMPIGEAIVQQRELLAGASTSHAPIEWKTWSQEAVEASVRAGNTVFVDVTADYCTNCKINKGVATYQAKTIERIEALGIVAFQADFSGGDEDIFEQLLQKHGQVGPPLNLVYPAGRLDDPIVLPTMFDLDQLLAALEKAGPSRGHPVARRGS